MHDEDEEFFEICPPFVNIQPPLPPPETIFDALQPELPKEETGVFLIFLGSDAALLFRKMECVFV